MSTAAAFLATRKRVMLLQAIARHHHAGQTSVFTVAAVTAILPSTTIMTTTTTTTAMRSLNRRQQQLGFSSRAAAISTIPTWSTTMVVGAGARARVWTHYRRVKDDGRWQRMRWTWYPSSSYLNGLARRAYFFVPTSWTELQLQLGFRSAIKAAIRARRNNVNNQNENTISKSRNAPSSLYTTSHRNGGWWSSWWNSATEPALATTIATSTSTTTLTKPKCELEENWTKKASQRVHVSSSNSQASVVSSPSLATTSSFPSWRFGTDHENIDKQMKNYVRVRLHKRHILRHPRPHATAHEQLDTTNTNSDFVTHYVTLLEPFDPLWFDDHGRPRVSRDVTGRFVNPWAAISSNGIHSARLLIKWRYQRLQRMIHETWHQFIGTTSTSSSSSSSTLATSATPASRNRISPTTTASTDVAAALSSKVPSTSSQEPMINAQSSPSAASSVVASENVPALEGETPDNANAHLRLTWLGHATCWMQFQPNKVEGDEINGRDDNVIHVLTDPMFSARASPFAWTGLGAPRYPTAPGLSSSPSWSSHELLSCLPSRIDFCLLSHDHYDHLDAPTIRALVDRVALWIVPTGVDAWLQRVAGIASHKIVTLQWWESVQLVLVKDHVKNKNLRSALKDAFYDRRQQQQQQQHQSAHEQQQARGTWKVVQRTDIDASPVHPTYQQQLHTSVQKQQEEEKNHHVWITCCPTQHWGSRSLWDRNTRLWASFACFFSMDQIHADEHPTTNDQQQQQQQHPYASFYFGGDSAFPCSRRLDLNNDDDEEEDDNEANDQTQLSVSPFPLYEQIADYVSGHNKPLDLAAIPIGAYRPWKLMQASHMHPAQAVQVCQTLQVRKCMAIHYGTMDLSEEAIHEPPQLLNHAVQCVNAYQQQQLMMMMNRRAMKNDDDARLLLRLLHPVDFVTVPCGNSISISCGGSKKNDII